MCPKFQVISSHFFKVDELLDEHWATIVWIENISTSIYVECDKMYQSKVWVQEFLYFVSGQVTLIFNLKNLSTTVLYAKKSGGKIRKVIYFFFWSDWYKTMAQWLRLVVESLATWVLFFMSAETLCSVSAILRNTEPAVHWHALFLYCCALSFSFFLDFVSGYLARTEL